MSEPRKVHIFKCPGSYQRDGVCYSLRSHTEGDKLPEEWFYTLAEAVKAVGKIALAPIKVDTPKKIKLMGMPVKPHEPVKEDPKKAAPVEEAVKAPEPPSEEVEEEKPLDDGENFKRYEELTKEELNDLKIALSVDGVDEKGLRDEFNIHHLTLKKIKAELK